MVMQTIFPGCGQKFINGDKYHDPGHSGKDKTKQFITEEGHQNKIGQQGTNGLGQSGKKGEIKTLFFLLPVP